MARVEIATQPWGVVQDRAGNTRSGLAFSLTTVADGAVTRYAAATGGTTDTSTATNSNGEIPGFVEAGSYKVSVGGITKQVEALSGFSDVSGLDSRLTAVEENGPYTLLDTSLISGANCDAALTQAKADLGAAGGRIIVPDNLEILNPPSFSETSGLILEGASGLSAGAGTKSRLLYKGTGARALDARSSHGFGLRDLQLVADQAGFTGNLVDLSHSIALDASFAAIERCWLGGSGSCRPAVNVLLNNAICLSLRDVSMAHAALGVKGRVTMSDYSNGIKLDTVTFVNMTDCGVESAGQGWHFANCIFQQLASGAAGAYRNGAGLSGGNAVTFTGGWCGDANSSGTWFDWNGNNLVMQGVYISTGAVGVALAPSSFGAVVVNDYVALTTALNISAGCTDVFDVGSSYTSVTNRRVNAGAASGNVWTTTGGAIALSKLAVANSAAATTPGSVVKKIQVYDENGTSLGFVPVYSAIT